MFLVSRFGYYFPSDIPIFAGNMCRRENTLTDYSITLTLYHARKKVSNINNTKYSHYSVQNSVKSDAK